MKSPYVRFGLTLLASLMLMFLLSMSQIRTFEHFHLNLSNLLMAGLMVSVMGLLMLVAMPSMFPDRRLNMGLLILFVALVVVLFGAARTQPFVGDQQFLESMIPHHSRAILVCQEADLTDPEIIELCAQIVQTQQEEIIQMEGILDRL